MLAHKDKSKLRKEMKWTQTAKDKSFVIVKKKSLGGLSCLMEEPPTQVPPWNENGWWRDQTREESPLQKET